MHLVRIAVVALATLVFAPPAIAQKRCVKGIPCGNTCIAANKTCHVGTGSARSSTTSTRATQIPAGVTAPPGAQFVASSRGRVYYWVGCNAWKSLSPSNLVFFTTAEEAQKAGYRASQASGCAGPTGDTAAPAAAEGAVAAGASAALAADGGTPLTTPVTTVPELASFRVCTIARVVDGDTVECSDGERVRLLLIDAPERDQAPYGPMAALALEAVLPVGTPARLELDVQERDRYGRLLAYVYHPDGRLANEKLVEQGYAVVSVYPPNVKYVDRIRAAADRAKAGGYGLWATPAFECLPADHRAGKCD